jgi:signal transduction histidine kinase
MSLTELHGGTMRLRSAPSVGTVVLVRLPLKGRPQMPSDRAAPTP